MPPVFILRQEEDASGTNEFTKHPYRTFLSFFHLQPRERVRSRQSECSVGTKDLELTDITNSETSRPEANLENMPEYNDSNRAFLQAFMARSSMTFEDAQPILAAILTVSGT